MLVHERLMRMSCRDAEEAMLVHERMMECFAGMLRKPCWCKPYRHHSVAMETRVQHRLPMAIMSR